MQPGDMYFDTGFDDYKAFVVTGERVQGGWLVVEDPDPDTYEGHPLRWFACADEADAAKRGLIPMHGAYPEFHSTWTAVA